MREKGSVAILLLGVLVITGVAVVFLFLTGKLQYQTASKIAPQPTQEPQLTFPPYLNPFDQTSTSSAAQASGDNPFAESDSSYSNPFNDLK